MNITELSNNSNDSNLLDLLDLPSNTNLLDLPEELNLLDLPSNINLLDLPEELNLLDLPEELNSNILNYLNLKEMIKILNCNKYFFVNFYDKFQNHKKRFIKDKVPSHIFNIIKNYDFSKIKYLDFKHNYIGLDYIDGIRIKDVDYPIMFSIDNFRRPCLIFLLNLKNNNKSFNIVHTIFQRYTLNKKYWVFGSFYSNYKIHNQALPSDEDLLNYKNIAENKIINVPYYQVKLG